MTVGDCEPHLGHPLPQLVGEPIDRLDPVVDDKGLSSAIEFGEDRIADAGLCAVCDRRTNLEAVLGRGGDDRHFANARESHLHRPRDGCRGEREHVDCGAQALEACLLLDAESMLLVDDHEPESRNAHFPAEDCGRAHDDVDLSARQALDGVALGSRAHEPGQQADLDIRVTFEATPKALEMLVGEHGGRSEHRDLPAGLDDPHRCTHRNLGLAEPHVAADQPVHGEGLGEVFLDRLDGLGLVWSLFVGKACLEGLVSRSVIGVWGSGGEFASGKQPQQLLGHRQQVVADLALAVGPGLASELVEHDLDVGVRGAVSRELVEARDRHEHVLLAAVLELDEVVCDALRDIDAHQPKIAPHSVTSVNDGVADLEVSHGLHRTLEQGVRPLADPTPDSATEHRVDGHVGQTGLGRCKTARQIAE